MLRTTELLFPPSLLMNSSGTEPTFEKQLIDRDCFAPPDPFGTGIGRIKMFDNLVESGSHKEDLSRKGSFLLGTLAIYAVLGTALIVGSIWLTLANIDTPDLELTTLVAPVPVPQQATPDKPQEAKPQKVEQNVDVRKELIADVSR